MDIRMEATTTFGLRAKSIPATSMVVLSVPSEEADFMPTFTCENLRHKSTNLESTHMYSISCYYRVPQVQFLSQKQKTLVTNAVCEAMQDEGMSQNEGIVVNSTVLS